ncbi:MAG: hypothetical protein IKO67_01955, partial [Bacteroidaceae bacterium]|nr:hypothetical protein [Bacteroidaceae bacterium]
SFAPASLTAKEPFRDAYGIAASLSKAPASFAPASLTAKEPFRDAAGIQLSTINYQLSTLEIEKSR